MFLSEIDSTTQKLPGEPLIEEIKPVVMWNKMMNSKNEKKIILDFGLSGFRWNA